MAERNRQRIPQRFLVFVVAAALVALSPSSNALLAVGARSAETTDHETSDVTLSFPAVADAYVSSFKPKSNYGATPKLKAGSIPTLMSYLKFAVAGTGGAVVSATLNLYVTPESGVQEWPEGYEVSGVSDNGWDEQRITYSTAPPRSAVVGSSGHLFARGWSRVDVTALVTGDGVISLALTTASKSAMGLTSREAKSNAPSLEVMVRDVTPPTVPLNLEALAVGPTRIDLSWSRSTDDVGVASYTAYRDDAEVGIVDGAATAFQDTSVEPGKTYTYTVDASDAAGNRSAPSSPVVISTPPAPTGQRIFAYYYLWWSTQHWIDKLGPNFPYGQSPLPLPATLESDGCGAVSSYPGNYLTDTPAALWSQDDPRVIESDVRAAAGAGIAGFLVNWNGTGKPDQTVASNSNNLRLELLVQAVGKVNAEGTPFTLWVSYKASSVILSADYIRNDWTYFKRQYGASAAFEHAYSNKITMVWTGSRKYDLPTIQDISNEFRSSFFMVGDENWNTWGDGRAAYLDGDTYYWSTQNPITNPSSYGQLQNLASMVRGSGPNPDGSQKPWFAPFTPGYNNELSGGTCVPRNSGQMMKDLFAGNALSTPDAWALISWNEITEGSYVQPLQRYGRSYLDILASLINP